MFVKVGQPPAVDIHRQVAFVSRLKMHPSVVVFGGGGLNCGGFSLCAVLK